MSNLPTPLKDLADKILADTGVTDGKAQKTVAEVVFISSMLSADALQGKDISKDLLHLKSALLSFADKDRQIVVLNLVSFFQQTVAAVIAKALLV